MKHRIAFVGAGWIADFYKAAQERLTERVELAGCCGNPSAAGAERLKAKCAQWGCPSIPSFEDVLRDPSIDCVAVLSPTSLHPAQAIAALRAGKHVLVEKPVALNASDLTAIGDAAAAAGKVAFPGHNFVYRPVVRKAKELIDSGSLGTISYASFRAVHFIPPEHAAGWRKGFAASGGGAMMDSGTHLVYQSLYLLGQPEFLSCFLSKKHYLQMDGEDTCQISLRYPDGAIGQIFQSWSSSDPGAGEIRIEGDKGVLTITDGLYHDGVKVEADHSYQDSFYHTLAAFLDALDGSGAVLSDIESAASTLAVIQKAYGAAEQNKVISFRAV